MFEDETEGLGARLHDWLEIQQCISHMFAAGESDPLFAWLFSTRAGSDFWEENKTAYSAPFVRRVEAVRARVQG